MSKNILLCLFVVSLIFHIAGWITSLVFMSRATKGSNLYAFYRPRVTGEKVQPTSNFIASLNTAYKTTCANDPASIKNLLVLASSYDANLDLENFMQTWMPATYRLFGLENADGYWMLFVVFLMSMIFQSYFIRQVLRPVAGIDFFRRPCLARWLEYAATSPVQVVLVASCVMIRDVYTLLLLFAAQLVCVLLGFPIEVALQNQRLATRMLGELQDAKFAVTLKKVCDENEYEKGEVETDFKNVSPPELQVLIDHSAAQSSVDFFERVRATSRNLWIVCMSASFMLHIFVWFILIDQLSSVLRESDCYDGPTEWQPPLQIVVYGQLVLFTLFALVPVVQILQARTKSKSTSAIFLGGSIAYAVLSVVAKTLLVATYIAFVRLFPFKTVNPNAL